MDHITDRHQITGHSGLFRERAIAEAFACPLNVFGRHPMPVGVIFNAFNAQSGLVLANLQNNCGVPLVLKVDIAGNFDFR
jgi:hypothetical protein